MMFDVSLWELLVVFLVALLVLGPEQLLQVAGKLGRSVGHLRRLYHQFQQSLSVDAPPEGGASSTVNHDDERT